MDLIEKAEAGVAEVGAELKAVLLSPAEKLKAEIAALEGKLVGLVREEAFKLHFMHSDGSDLTDQYDFDSGFLRAVGGWMQDAVRAGEFPNWHTTPPADLKARVAAEVAAGNYVGAGIVALLVHAQEVGLA